MTNPKRIMQGAGHHIDNRGITHSRAPALRWQDIGTTAHHLDTASKRGIAIAKLDKLGCAHNRLKATSA